MARILWSSILRHKTGSGVEALQLKVTSSPTACATMRRDTWWVACECEEEENDSFAGCFSGIGIGGAETENLSPTQTKMTRSILDPILDAIFLGFGRDGIEGQ